MDIYQKYLQTVETIPLVVRFKYLICIHILYEYLLFCGFEFPTLEKVRRLNQLHYLGTSALCSSCVKIFFASVVDSGSFRTL